VVFAVTMTMAVFADDAEAAIKVGEKVYEADHAMLDAAKGLCEVIAETSYDNETQNQAKNCISLINRHAASGEIVDVADHLERGGELIQKVISTIKASAAVASEEKDTPLMQTIAQLIDLGKEQSLEITTKISKTYTKISTEYGHRTSSTIRRTISRAGEMVPMKGKVDYPNIARALGQVATGVGK